MMVTFEEIVKSEKIAIVGLGYVGLPLAVAFGRKVKVIGLDVSEKRVAELKEGSDITGELSPEELKSSSVDYTSDLSKLGEARFIIVTVPTPIDGNNKPDLGPIEKASASIGRHIKKGSIVVLESTVYPGVTEEVAAPIIERASGLRAGVDFKMGYSPERINPGDKVHTVDKIVKVVSGSDPQTLDTVARVYELVVTAGVHRASSIKVAEAAKVIENTQRDINIALMNELAIIFAKMGIDTGDVLAAAGTKWNFLKFYPGLVGGHCIGVDPYYLTFKAESLGYHPEVILAGRRLNDSMGKYVAEMTVKQMIRSGKSIQGSKVLVLGMTFKENVRDIRNTKVIDIINELEEFGVGVLVHDPYADPVEVKKEYGFELCDLNKIGKADSLIVAVAHDAYKNIDADAIRNMVCNRSGSGVVVDIKGILDPEAIRDKGLYYWGLV